MRRWKAMTGRIPYIIQPHQFVIAHIDSQLNAVWLRFPHSVEFSQTRACETQDKAFAAAQAGLFSVEHSEELE